MSHLFRGSAHAMAYAKFRPHPPKQLIDTVLNYLSERVPRAEWRTAVDVGCGTGQACQPLAAHFTSVLGFDTSSAQINEAIGGTQMPNISFRVSPAENLPIEANSVQLLTACQSVHWFDLEKFFAEVNRVLSPNGVIALFGYKMPDISHQDFINSERVKNLCHEFYQNPSLIWSKKERQLVDQELASISLPFADQIRNGHFEAVIQGSALQLRGYLLSWSGLNSLFNVDKEAAQKILDTFDSEIKEIFGDKCFNEIEVNLHFKYHLLMARKR